MIRKSSDYREAIRRDRDIFLDGERIGDVTTHPAFAPAVDLRARIYDMQEDPRHRDVLTRTVAGQTNTVIAAVPFPSRIGRRSGG